MKNLDFTIEFSASLIEILSSHSKQDQHFLAIIIKFYGQETNNIDYKQHRATIPEKYRIQRKKLYALKQWNGRFQHYIKRAYNIDNKQNGQNCTNQRKKTEIKHDLISGASWSAIENITKQKI